MKNKLTDLNNHLFAELERLGDEDLKGEELLQEIARAKMTADAADKVVAAGTPALNAVKAHDNATGDLTLPVMLE
jgi:hypothetical protein